MVTSRHVTAMKALLCAAQRDGDTIQQAWLPVLTTLQHLVSTILLFLSPLPPFSPLFLSPSPPSLFLTLPPLSFSLSRFSLSHSFLFYILIELPFLRVTKLLGIVELTGNYNSRKLFNWMTLNFSWKHKIASGSWWFIKTFFNDCQRLFSICH